MNMKNNHLYPGHCPHCNLKFQFTSEDMVTEFDYCSVFENWIEWSTFVYCPICETPITIGEIGNKFWSLFTLRYFYKKLFNKIKK